MKRILSIGLCVIFLIFTGCDLIPTDSEPEEETNTVIKTGSIKITLDTDTGNYIGKTIHCDVFNQGATPGSATWISGAVETVTASNVTMIMQKDGAIWYGESGKSYDLYIVIDMDSTVAFSGPVSGKDMTYTEGPIRVTITGDYGETIDRENFVVADSLFVKVKDLPTKYQGKNFIVAISPKDPFLQSEMIAGSKELIKTNGNSVHNQMYKYSSSASELSTEVWLENGSYYIYGCIDMNGDNTFNTDEPVIKKKSFTKNGAKIFRFNYPSDFATE
jgi:hypothetical protein